MADHVIIGNKYLLRNIRPMYLLIKGNINDRRDQQE